MQLPSIPDFNHSPPFSGAISASSLLLAPYASSVPPRRRSFSLSRIEGDEGSSEMGRESEGCRYVDEACNPTI